MTTFDEELKLAKEGKQVSRKTFELMLIAMMNALEKEGNSVSPQPIEPFIQDLLKGENGAPLEDYSWYMNTLHQAFNSLAEGLKNGQHLRVSFAMCILEMQMVGLKTWLQVSGYIPDISVMLPLLNRNNSHESSDLQLNYEAFGAGKDLREGVDVQWLSGEDLTVTVVKDLALLHEDNKFLRAVQIVYKTIPNANCYPTFVRDQSKTKALTIQVERKKPDVKEPELN